MSLSGLVLGLVNIVIVVLVLLLVGAFVWWGAAKLNMSLDDTIRQLYLGLVGAIAIYMVLALIFGLPSLTIMR